MKEIFVKTVTYKKDYILTIQFNDGFSQIINFKYFLFSSYHPDITKYQDLDQFKNFKITQGDLQWNDYELCFPIADLYENKNIESKQNHAA